MSDKKKKEERRRESVVDAPDVPDVPDGPDDPPQKQGSDGKLWALIACVVVVLAGLVWWSLPGDVPANIGSDEAGAAGDPDRQTEAGSTRPPGGAFDRPSHASADFAVITDKPEEEIKKIAVAAEVAKRLDTKHCGGACDAVRKFINQQAPKSPDEQEGAGGGFEINIMKADDLILPPRDSMDTVALDLSPSERETVHSRKTAVSVRTSGPTTPEQMPARAAFAATAILAELLGGFVYDEASRRIETARTFATHAITVPLGQPAFSPRHVLIQFYRQEDSTARLLTLGMARFGSPDLSLRGAGMSSGPLLAHVLNVVASQIAHGKNESTITVTLDDVAKLLGKKPADLSSNPTGARPVIFDINEPERIEGDPDNELAELVPKGGSSRETWDGVVASLFGEPASVRTALDDKELVDVATKARRDLPNAIKRFQGGEGELYLKGPFPIPPESRVDGGAPTELLWISAASCDAKMCTGTLSNEPSYAMNLAAGKTVSVSRAEAVDWMIQQRDGGTAGGESIKVLKARLPK